MGASDVVAVVDVPKGQHVENALLCAVGKVVSIRKPHAIPVGAQESVPGRNVSIVERMPVELMVYRVIFRGGLKYRGQPGLARFA